MYVTHTTWVLDSTRGSQGKMKKVQTHIGKLGWVMCYPNNLEPQTVIRDSTEEELASPQVSVGSSLRLQTSMRISCQSLQTLSLSHRHWDSYKGFCQPSRTWPGWLMALQISHGSRTGVFNMVVPISTIHIRSLRVSLLATDMSGTRVLLIDMKILHKGLNPTQRMIATEENGSRRSQPPQGRTISWLSCAKLSGLEI